MNKRNEDCHQMQLNNVELASVLPGFTISGGSVGRSGVKDAAEAGEGVTLGRPTYQTVRRK